MDRLTKKCVITSGVLHGTLVLVLLIGPAFFVSQDTEIPKQLDFIPFQTLDKSLSGGGNPNVPQQIPPQQLQQAQPQQPAPTPPAPKPPTPKPPVVERDTPKTETPKPAPVKTEDTGWKPRKPDVSLTLTTRKPAGSTKTTPDTRANERAKAIESAANTIANSASGSVKVDELRGPGGGGVPYAGFKDALVSAYWNVWLLPSDTVNETSTVKVSVTLRRDGSVISARIQTRSGNSSLDASVQRALDKVSFVAPFPPSMKEAQKTFWLEFDPKAKRMMG